MKIVELRLRFIGLMVITALAFAYFDELQNRYEKWSRRSEEASARISKLEYFCPMHPPAVHEGPENCPTCGMPLSVRKKGKHILVEPGVTAIVKLSSAQVVRGGIKTSKVVYRHLSRHLRTLGYISLDERGISNIASKVPGRSRIERLRANAAGQRVEIGQVLAEIYSPELFQAARELILAARGLEPAADAPRQTEAGRTLAINREGIFRAASEKLRRWGIAQAQIDDILKRGKSDLAIPILSTRRGVVVKKNVVEGQEVQEGYSMFEVADLDTVWVQSQVFEHQLGQVREGQAAELSVEAYPGETFAGEVEFIQPRLDAATRSAEVRITLPNPKHRLIPGMLATVVLQIPSENGAKPRPSKIRFTSNDEPDSSADLVHFDASEIPPNPDMVLSIVESAVIDTGERKVVYVETSPGVFEGREVILGARSGDRYPVLGGLRRGENVATSGAFLIDAESRINPNPSSTISDPDVLDGND